MSEFSRSPAIAFEQNVTAAVDSTFFYSGSIVKLVLLFFDVVISYSDYLETARYKLL